MYARQELFAGAPYSGCFLSGRIVYWTYMRFFWLRCVLPFRSPFSFFPFADRAARCSDDIQKYLGITLLPQAGVALGMAATAAQLSDGHMVRSVVLFSVLVYELAGPTLTKIALTAAGEIRPEGRTCARVENKPEEVA